MPALSQIMLSKSMIRRHTEIWKSQEGTSASYIITGFVQSQPNCVSLGYFFFKEFKPFRSVKQPVPD